MKVNAAVFRKNMSEYFQKSETEDIYITRHGKTVGVLVSPLRLEEKTSDRAAIETYMRITQEHLAEMLRVLKEK